MPMADVTRLALADACFSRWTPKTGARSQRWPAAAAAAAAARRLYPWRLLPRAAKQECFCRAGSCRELSNAHMSSASPWEICFSPPLLAVLVTTGWVTRTAQAFDIARPSFAEAARRQPHSMAPAHPGAATKSVLPPNRTGAFAAGLHHTHGGPSSRLASRGGELDHRHSSAERPRATLLAHVARGGEREPRGLPYQERPA
eukprot:COSAG06_NODE_272_length_18674_cov_18.029717_2_plen_201_part_00